MNHQTRQPIYQQIEAERKTKVLALVNSDRLNLQTQIAADAINPFVQLLDEIGPTERLSLILDTNGGQTSAGWRLINLIRSFCDDLEVIVPTKAMSAGTLMALGADRILMTKQGALGPIDPSLANHPLSPTVVSATGQQIKMPVSAEAVRGYIDEVKKDVTDPAALASVWNHLADKIHPIVLGEIFRLGGQIRNLASDLIQNQVPDKDRQADIIQHLCSDSGSHDYTINRRK
ncbi:SDH family Clp fold serine proteinase, partial [Hyphococcus sp.]